MLTATLPCLPGFVAMACAFRRIVFSLSCWRITNVLLLRSRRPLYAIHGVGRQAHLPSLRHYSAAGAGMRLLSCVQEEVGLEQGLTEQLPVVTGFDTTVSGCTATLQRQHGTEKVVVELDTHNAVEVIPEELGEEGEEEEAEPIFVPAFTVTITNLAGSRLQVDCSFDENKSYVEQGNEWDNLTIDTVSVTPPNSQDTDSVYTLSADNLSTDLYDSLVGYLQERGIDQRFAVEVVQFYRVHEHRCYVEHSLKALRNFLKDH